MSQANEQQRVVLPGSRRPAIEGSISSGPANERESIIVTVYIRHAEESPQSTLIKRVLSRDEFAASRGASPQDLQEVREFAGQYGLKVASENAVKRSVELEGTVAAMSTAFGVTLETVRLGNDSYRQQVGAITIPAQLAPILVAVLGLDNRPQASQR